MYILDAIDCHININAIYYAAFEMTTASKHVMI